MHSAPTDDGYTKFNKNLLVIKKITILNRCGMRGNQSEHK